MKSLILITLIASADPSDYVRFEQTKLMTYDEGLAESKKSAKPLIVWVGVKDFGQYMQVKNKNVLHIYVDKFPGLERGVVIGTPKKGDVERSIDITEDYVANINKFFETPKQALIQVEPPVQPLLFNPFPTRMLGGCPGGVCPR